MKTLIAKSKGEDVEAVEAKGDKKPKAKAKAKAAAKTEAAPSAAGASGPAVEDNTLCTAK